MSSRLRESCKQCAKLPAARKRIAVIKKRLKRRSFTDLLEEREGFEPSVLSLVRLISSQVHSTTLPPLRCCRACDYSRPKPGF